MERFVLVDISQYLRYSWHMIDAFDYRTFRRDFLALKHAQPVWWRDKAIWQEREYTTPVHRPTEIQAFNNIAHECHTYTRYEVKANRGRAFDEVLREVLVDMRQEHILIERIDRHRLTLKQKLTARGETLMWVGLDTSQRRVYEVLANP